VVVPGNHDIRWCDRSAQPEVDRKSAEQDYRDFLDRLFSPNHAYRLTSDLGYCHVFRTREELPQPVVLLALNSCRIETSYTPGLGWVGYDQIYRLIGKELLRLTT